MMNRKKTFLDNFIISNHIIQKNEFLILILRKVIGFLDFYLYKKKFQLKNFKIIFSFLFLFKIFKIF